jgi:hypothetical protein
MDRLERQISWYDSMSLRNLRTFKILKAWTIVIAALVPLLATFHVSDPRIFATLTASIAVVEAFQQLNQYQANWILYRSTCEALKREEFLFLSLAGPYNGIPHPEALFSERVEDLVSQEHAKWTSYQERRREEKTGQTKLD